MKRFQWIAFAISMLLSTQTIAEESGDWFRHASISPNGKSIAFSYQGDVYAVSVDGGLARALTTNEAWDGYPIWSSDGKHIAFASDRHGNLDVYLMSSGGGKAKRLTYHSSNDIPSDFSVDNAAVLFSAARTESPDSSFFPTSRVAELYEVGVDGGTPRMVSTIGSSQARYSADGKKILYRDEKAYENEFRKHDVSAFARDIWLHDLESGQHTKLTDFAGGDHNPVWHGNNKVFYLSENKSNNFNVWQMDAGGKNKKQVSSFDTHPVRHLSVSDDGRLCYTQHGALFTQSVGKDPKSAVVHPRTHQ